MDLTAPAVAEQEHVEPQATLDRKADTLAMKIRESKHFIAFTGAGVSTSAGIPDFRGPDGNWTLRAQGRTREGPKPDTLKAVPTFTHMALVELQNRGLLKYLVSQNCDGLHRRSGIRPEMIAELHGNSNRESCKDCGKDYIRDFRAVATYEHSDVDHRTGRRCACGGELHDTIVNFGEDLPAEALRLAREHAARADLCLVLGSSLRVTPACEIPAEVKGGRRRRGGPLSSTLAICNLQKTGKDGLADIRVFARTDDLMARVMDRLGVPVPAFVLRRRVHVVEGGEPGREQVSVVGVDTDGTPVSLFKSVRAPSFRRVLTAEPFIFRPNRGIEAGAALAFELEFMGHYNEPKLTLAHEFGRSRMYLLAFDPQTGKWAVETEGEGEGEGV